MDQFEGAIEVRDYDCLGPLWQDSLECVVDIRLHPYEIAKDAVNPFTGGKLDCWPIPAVHSVTVR